MNQSKNNELKSRLEVLNLFDLYKDFLTDKQKQYFEDYYFNDMSLSEISITYNVSRNAILDSNKKTIQILLDFENKLNLLDLREKILNILD
ncbi:MAG: DNA-binding protein, partial [Ureaplasma sp.]|nr:DNA-binding protein [Ureaplasma sp.]